MQTELISLSKAFNEFLYRIPDYQRGYSWGEKQLKDFWNDLDQLESGKNHYTGVLTLEAVAPEVYKTWEDDLWILESKNFKPFFVVDGQQRLTTAIILVQTILESAEEGTLLNYDTKEEVRKRYIFQSKDGGISRSYIFGYERDNPSYEFLKTEIFQEESDSHSTAEETIYTQNLRQAKEYFKSKTDALEAHERVALYTKVTQNLLFNVFTIAQEIDVFVAFETMNNRGKPLSHLELLKNRLIYLSTRFPSGIDGESVDYDRTALRKVVNESWKSAYHYLGRNREIPLDDDEFLLIQFLLYFNTSLLNPSKDDEPARFSMYRYTNDDFYKDFLLDHFFTARRVSPKLAGRSSIPNRGPRATRAALQATQEVLSGAFEVSEQPLEPIDPAVIYNYAKDIKNSVAVYYKVNNPRDTNYSSEEKICLERITRYERVDAILLAVAVYKKKRNLQEKIDFIKELERTLFFKTLLGYSYDFVFDLNYYAVQLSGGEISLATLIAEFRKHNDAIAFSKDLASRIVISKQRGYYNWRAIRLFLFEYEQHLLGLSKTNREKISWREYAAEDFGNDYVTVEHIYPQKAAHASWKTEFDLFSTKERNALKHSLGNLVPLSKKKNSSLSNKSFSDKKGSAENKVGFYYGSYAEQEVAQLDNWTPMHIRDRGIQLLAFMEKRWNCRLGSADQKTMMLGLSGINFDR